jgi:hypothetical protein
VTEERDKATPLSPAEAYEQEFFARMSGDSGAPHPEDWVDPELEGLAPGVSLGRPALLLLVAVFSVFLAGQYTGELRYFFTSNEPIDLGHAEELRQQDEWHDASGALALPSNRYVDIDGMVEARSGSAERVFYKLVGADVLVQTLDVDDRPRILRDEPIPVVRGTESLHPMHDEPGRLLALEQLPSRYEAVVRWYSDAQRVHYCGFDPSPELTAYLNNRRGRVELALTDALGRRPTDEEISLSMGDDGTCRRGYLLMAGQSPRDAWYYPVIYVVLTVIFLVSVWLLVQSMREVLAARET